MKFMEHMTSDIIVNTAAFLIMLGILVFSKRIRKHVKTSEQFYHNMVITVMTASAFDALSHIMRDQDGLVFHLIGAFSTTLFMICLLLLIFRWLLYVDYMVYGSRERLERYRFHYLPILILVLAWFFMLVLSVVYFSNGFVLKPTILLYLTQITGLIYFLLTIRIILIHIRKKSIREYAGIVLVVITVLMGAAMDQVSVHSTTALGIALGLLFLYSPSVERWDSDTDSESYHFISMFMHSLGFKGIVSLMFLLCAFYAVVGIHGGDRFSEIFLNYYKDGALRVAKNSAILVNGDHIEEYLETKGNSQEYKLALLELQEFCNATAATFIYVIRPDLEDFDEITFIFSTVNENRDEYSPFDIGYVKTTTNEEYKERYREFFYGDSDGEVMVLQGNEFDEKTNHITAMVPVRDNENRTQAILCVQRSVDMVIAARQAYVRGLTQVLIVFMVLAGLAMGVYMYIMIILPMRNISEEMSRFAANNTLPEKKLRESIHNRDEIGKIANSVDWMEEEIKDNIRNMTRITAERERIGAELKIGTAIQSQMLPDNFEDFSRGGSFKLYAFMNPAREVGGDLYDFFEIDEDHTGLCIADVSDKGVPAAFYMAIVKTLIRNNGSGGSPPDVIMEQMNQQLVYNVSLDMFVTVWFGIYEHSTGKLSYVNAGHEYPVIYREKEGSYSLQIEDHDVVCGMMEDIEYTAHTIELSPGDRIFLYTDGLEEAWNPGDEKYGTDRLVEALNATLDCGPKETIEKVRKDVISFVEGAEQSDDVTMMVVYL